MRLTCLRFAMKRVSSNSMTVAGDYLVNMWADHAEIMAQGEDEYLKAREKDSPLLRLIDEENPPVTPVWKARTAQ